MPPPAQPHSTSAATKTKKQRVVTQVTQQWIPKSLRFGNPSLRCPAFGSGASVVLRRHPALRDPLTTSRRLPAHTLLPGRLAGRSGWELIRRGVGPVVRILLVRPPGRLTFVRVVVVLPRLVAQVLCHRVLPTPIEIVS